MANWHELRLPWPPPGFTTLKAVLVKIRGTRLVKSLQNRPKKIQRRSLHSWLLGLAWQRFKRTRYVARLINKVPKKYRRWAFGWPWTAPKDQLTTNEWIGFQPGSRQLYLAFAPFFLAISSLGSDNHKVVGIQNVHKFIRAVEAGRSGTILADHKSFADIFMLQCLLAPRTGKWAFFTKRVLPFMGLLYYSRYPIQSLMMRASPVIVTPPPTIRSQGPTRKTLLDMVEAIKTEYPIKQDEGYVGLGYFEGGRSKDNQIHKAHATLIQALARPGAVIMSVGYEGVEEMMKPADKTGLPLPNFATPVKLIVDFLEWDEIAEQAAQLELDYYVSFDEAAADLIYRNIALGHKQHGNAKYMGHYHKPLEEIYTARVKKEGASGG